MLATVGLQAAMNIAVVTASMPTKGISLPFLSFGGSGLFFTLAAMGFVVSVGAEPAPQPIPASPESPEPRALTPALPSSGATA